MFVTLSGKVESGYNPYVIKTCRNTDYMWSILHNNILKITHARKTRLTPTRVT